MLCSIFGGESAIRWGVCVGNIGWGWIEIFGGSACVRDRSSGYEEEKLTKANGAGIRDDGKEMRDCVLYTYPGTNRLQVVVGVGRDGITTWIRKKEKMEQEMITHLVVRCEYLAMPAAHPPTR